LPGEVVFQAWNRRKHLHSDELFPWDQFIGTTTQSLPNTGNGRDQNIGFPGLDLLDIPNVDVNEFRQTRLRHFNGVTFPPDIGSKALELRVLADSSRHVPQPKNFAIDGNDTLWRNLIALTGKLL
jgi:hypothetical protein